jgi:hypothetical protein
VDSGFEHGEMSPKAMSIGPQEIDIPIRGSL